MRQSPPLMTNEQVRVGGWLLAIYKAISYYDVDDPVFDEYEATVIAGKTAQYLSSIRALGKIDASKHEVYRKIARLKPRPAIEVLKELEKLSAVEVEWKKNADPPAVISVKTLVTSKAEVLATSSKVFDQFQPTPSARAAVEALDSTLHLPIPETEVLSALARKGFHSPAVSRAIETLVKLELLARTIEKESGAPLLYNPHVFKKSAGDAYKALSALSTKDHEHALALLEHVRTKPGIPFPKSSDKRIIDLLAKTGIIDISGIQLKSGTTTREFPTAPDIWGVFTQRPDGGVSEDLIDDSKLLLNSFRYGELYSPPGRGRIESPSVLINALITRGQVGPATAIGEDYPLPLARGIVSITESRLRPGRFFMELRKNDVAESVRDVLEQNAILPAGDIATPDVLQEGGGTFHSPEHLRMKRQLPKELVEVRDSLAFELRTHRKRT
jgi:hypothetical protein